MHIRRLWVQEIVAATLTLVVGCNTPVVDPIDNRVNPVPVDPIKTGSSADTNTILLPLQDPRGDQTGAIDVTGMLMVVNRQTGAYVIYLLADAEHPFAGSYRININLYDQDLGTSARYPSFFSNVMNDYINAPPATMKTLSGTDPCLREWHPGNRVFTNSLASTGNPEGISLFRSSVWGLFGPGTGWLDNEDVIAMNSLATPIRIMMASGVNVTASSHLTEAQCRQILGI